MNDMKLCPLVTRMTPDTNQSFVRYCPEGRCAWWDEEGQCCMVATMGKSLKKTVKK